MKLKTKSEAKSFEALLERGASRLNWTIARIPFDVHAAWGTRGQLRVKGDINGFPFRTSLFPTGQGEHILLVNKRMQAGARCGPGRVARIRLEPDTEKRVVTIPKELDRALAEDKAVRRWFDQLNHSTRNYIAQWIAEVKSAEARLRRTDQIVERLLAVMDAERELPPILRVAFSRDPRAFEGWQRMSLAQRRGHLMAIYYYREPKAQARRLAQALEDARRVAEKKNRPTTTD